MGPGSLSTSLAIEKKLDEQARGEVRWFGLPRFPFCTRVRSGGGSKVHVLLAEGVGLRINMSKTKVLSAYLDSLLHQVVNVGDELLEEVLSFKYLGASFTATVQAFGEIKARINVAWVAFDRLQPSLWSRPEIWRRTKGSESEFTGLENSTRVPKTMYRYK